MKDTSEGNDCFFEPIFKSNLEFDSLQSSRTMIIEKGAENVNFGEQKFSLALIGSYNICFRAIISVSQTLFLLFTSRKSIFSK